MKRDTLKRFVEIDITFAKNNNVITEYEMYEENNDVWAIVKDRRGKKWCIGPFHTNLKQDSVIRILNDKLEILRRKNKEN